MKRMSLFGMLLLLVSVSTDGQHRVSTTTGNSLLETCSSVGKADELFCLGYIGGVADVDGLEGATFPERQRSCVPDNVSNGQLMDVVVKYLKEHPEERHMLAAILIVEALTKAFPCKR